MVLSGFATTEGTARYRQHFAAHAAPGHFRQQDGLWLSSVGVGTYLGEPDAETDRRYARAIARALELGSNVIDTAINYRLQRSERSVATALRTLMEQGKLARDEVVVCTKAGFLTFDGEPAPDALAYFQEHYVQPGVFSPDDVAAGAHCMTPRFLEDQLERSRRNLDLETIDVFYLHNPEMQLTVVPREEFLRRMRAAFEGLEKWVAAGRIRRYGTATWDGYRKPPEAPDYLSLEELVNLAEAVGGPGHHFKAIQLPYSLAMPEAFLRPNQTVAGEKLSLLAAARRLGITVFASASTLQGQVTRNFPDQFRARLNGKLRTDAQRAIQFVRSTPGVGVALVGMSRVEHVEENLHLLQVPVQSQEEFLQLFQRV
ncbi:MAG: aldo/keto reductase [Acidobacteria bacterium]|nr:aldo/keto reductase [Acidobacteriota bacterium]